LLIERYESQIVVMSEEVALRWCGFIKAKLMDFFVGRTSKLEDRRRRCVERKLKALRKGIGLMSPRDQAEEAALEESLENVPSFKPSVDGLPLEMLQFLEDVDEGAGVADTVLNKVKALLEKSDRVKRVLEWASAESDHLQVKLGTEVQTWLAGR